MRGTRDSASRLNVRLRLEPLEDRLTPVTWPVPVSHEMLGGFGDGIPASTFKFHEGIDVGADGNGGQDVVAIRGGTVLWNDAIYAGGMVTVEVPVGGGKFEYDQYLHVSNIAAPAEGTAIAEGAAIGKISSTYFTVAGSHHLHLQIFNKKPPRSAAQAENTHLNPLLRFAANADRDPLGNAPTLFDTNNDNKTLLVTPNGAYNTPFTNQPINGDVDLIADAVDPMNSTANLKFVASPHWIAYYIRPLFNQGIAAPLARGVKNSFTPYVLAKFDDAWFKGIPATPTTRAIKTSSKFNEVYDATHPAAVGTYPWQRLNHMVVTNTKGTDGKIDNVDENQYWNTNAKEDNGADWINYKGLPDATKNAEARFKDGDYEPHIVMTDLIQGVNLARKMRVVNFTRTVGVDTGGQASSQGLNPILYSPSTATWVPNFTPAPVVAGVAKTFWLGDTVGVNGEQYYPGATMGAYVTVHKPGGWNDGDDLSTASVAFTIVDSNGNGSVPLTQAWVASATGLYDVVIDYDNDGKFSWKLDGVNGFQVLPMIIIGNWVWGDINPEGPNGVQDPEEVGGLPGITVNLFKSDGTFVATTITGDNGYYEFQVAEEVPTWYYLEFVSPLGAHFSPKDVGSDTFDSDADPVTGLTDPFPSPQFAGGLIDDTRDAGMYAIPARPERVPPEPVPGSETGTSKLNSMELTSGLFPQTGPDTNDATALGGSYFAPNLGRTDLDQSNRLPTVEGDDVSVKSRRFLVVPENGNERFEVWLESLTPTLVAVIAGPQTIGADGFLDDDALLHGVGRS
jgi:SdrD B-like domain/Peptidase family M23